MKWSGVNAASAWTTKHSRDVCAPAIATLRCIVGQHVKPCGDEVYELKLRDGSHPHKRRTASRADNRRFRNRRVNHTVFAKLVQESIRHLERTAIDAHVLAYAEDRSIALHLFPDALTYRFNERGKATARRAI